MDGTGILVRFAAAAATGIVLMLGAGCAVGRGAGPPTHELPPASGAPELRTFVWECERAGRVVTGYRRSEGAMWLFLPDGTRKLAAQRVASGVRHGDDRVSFWSHGREAVLERDGAAQPCIEDRRLSVIEDAKLRGVSFWATGNEPGWTLEIGPERILLITDYGTESHSFETRPYQTDDGSRTSTMTTRRGEHSLVIQLEGRAGGCVDDMSAERFETRVLLTLDGRDHRGCGQALH